MTDQPKPNQPTNPPPPAQPVQKEASPAADKASSPVSSSEPKASSLPVDPKPDAAAKPAEAKPVAAPANSAPTIPTDNEPSTAQMSRPTAEDGVVPVPSKPATPESSAAQPAKPVTNENGVPPVPPKPATPESTSAPTKPAGSEESKPQPTSNAAPASSSAPTIKRDISEDPTVPGRPTPAEPAKATGLAAHSTTVPMSSSLLPGAPAPSGIGEKDDTIPPQSGGTKVTQRFTEPGPIGQSAGTICPSCGHRNRPGTLICDNCGTNLVGGVKSAVGTRDLVSATEAAAATDTPLLDAAQLNALESAGGSVFSDDMVLRIEIEGGATPMLVYPKQEIILGRRDPNTGTLPDVDMTAYSGYRMGVSRTHASIHLQDKQLNLSDRGSSNGTFLNGTRLVAHRPYPVKDGDEIRLGQMVLKVYFQSNKTRK